MKNSRFLKRAKPLALLSLLGLMAGFMLLGWVIPSALSLPDNLREAPESSPIYYTRELVVLQRLLTDEDARREDPVQLPEIADSMIHAILAAEDKNFFRHFGVDVLATARAVKDNFHAKRVISGASTLTQQLIKITSKRETSRGLSTKIREALLARHLEIRWSKEKILTAYLNRVDFGNQLHGIGAASLGYFGKSPADLSLAETAALASLPQNPTKLNPFRDPSRLKKRRNRVLELMHTQKRITTEDFELALQEPLRVQRFQMGFAAPHLVQMLKPELKRENNKKIVTSISHELQQEATLAVERQLNRVAGKNVNQAAVVVIENQTGKIRALVGSRDFWDSNEGQINGAWIEKSPGSALKPFTYLLAFEQGQLPSRIIPDLPVSYPTPTGNYSPENYNRQHYGPITLRQALGNSLNIPAVRLLHELGGESKLAELLLQLGITSLDPSSSHYGLGLTLGNAPVRLIELSNAYATLARLGQHLPWSVLEHETPPPTTAVFPPETAFLIADVLQDASARTLTFGVRSTLNFPFPCAVKTGTSTDYRDNWALGYTPEFTVGVWVGNFDNSAMQGVSGVTGAGPILRDVFNYLHSKHQLSWYTPSTKLTLETLDTRIQKRWNPNLSQNGSYVRKDWMFADNPIPEATTLDYSADGSKALLPELYKNWFAQSVSPMKSYLEMAPDGSSDQAARPPIFEFPQNGGVYYLDPELPQRGRKMRMNARSASPVQFTSPTLQVLQEGSEKYLMLEPGSHSLVAENANGKTTIKIQVKDLGHP